MKRIYIPVVSIFVLIFACTTLVTTPGCEEVAKILLDSSLSKLGYFANSTDTANVPDDISTTRLASGSGSSQNLPSSVDLRNYLPPIGNQGQYGTCVAWSVGYNTRTFLDAVSKGYTSTQLASASYQFSPKYLFWRIPSADKGSDCNGTGFESAFDILISNGAATLADVPYTNMGDCSSSASQWDSQAQSHKITNYRQIEYNNLNELKGYLAAGRLITFGARLGDNFMSWNSAAAISSDTYNNPGMMHAYHAMVCAGYDDTKNAFLVVNSWGEDWGNAGTIWVNYNFFMKNFCFAAYVSENQRSEPDENNDNVVDNDNIKTGKDLIAWELKDYGDDANDLTSRSISYNVYNAGSETIYRTTKWNILYLVYNAKDANDYQILLYDEYSSASDYSGLTPISGYTNIFSISGPGQTNYGNVVDVASGQSVAEALFGSGTNNMGGGYYMPKTLNGKYYLIVIADGFGTITETNEDNNYYYLTDVNGDPIQITNGVITSTLAAKKKSANKPKIGSPSPSETTRNARNVNAYTTEEISKMLQYHRSSGELQKRVKKFVESRKIHPKKKDI